MRTAGSTSRAYTASGSSGPKRNSRTDPTMRGSNDPSGCRTTRVYSQSWARMASRITASWGRTPTPQIPQSSPRPDSMSRSRYIASWERWKLPKPKWTTPTVAAVRS